MATLIRALDWAGTSLGPIASWPLSLRTAVSLCMGSNFPLAIYWGREFTLLYNDAWMQISGTRHPGALGRPGLEVWPETCDTIGSIFQQVMATGEATGAHDQLLPRHRHAYPYLEECYFDYTLSPIRGEDGQIVGIFNAVTETSYRVIAERRAQVLRDLAERTTSLQSVDRVCAAAAETLGAATADVPFCLLYLREADNQAGGGDIQGRRVQLAGIAGLVAGGAASPETIDQATADAAWTLPIGADRGVVVGDLTRRFGFRLPGGRWPEAPDCAVIMPIASAIPTAEATGFLVVGISPRRALDDAYKDFIGHAAARISTAIANARALEAERRHAETLAELRRATAARESGLRAELEEQRQRLALRERDAANLQLALAAGQLGNWELDLETGLALHSRRHDQIFGYDDLPSDWSYQVFRRHILREDLDQVERSYRDAIDAGSHWHFECRIRRADGEIRWIEAHGEPFRDSDGQMVRLLGILADITDRKRAEAEREVLKAAEAASRAKSAFLAMVSHELRTPLNAILGYSQILKGDPHLSERQVARVDTIHKSGQHLLTLIGDLLDLAKIEAGKVELSPTQAAFPAFLAQVADIVRVKAEQKSLLFTCEFAPDLPPVVVVDEQRLRQVLLNLLSNAVKYTDVGEVRLRVKTVSSNEASVRVHFEVADTGIGIAPAQQEVIFQPFEQVGDQHHRSGGTGLGLAISRQLVHLMGGEIAVDSRIGAGSRFTFDLTLRAAISRPSSAHLLT
jgi:PAS domain S-box-containing protein